VNLPVGGLVAILLVFLNIPEQIPKPKGLKSVSTVLSNLDLIGFVLFAPAAIMFLLALQYGGSTYPWNSATIIGLFCGAGVTFIIFMFWERRVGDRAMIPYSIFTIRTVWASCVTYGFLASMLICGSYYLPIYFQAIQNASPMISGVDILPSIISQVISAILSGQLCELSLRTFCNVYWSNS
jgi:Fungal trichothecene efflux pump (TRI12)